MNSYYDCEDITLDELLSSDNDVGYEQRIELNKSIEIDVRKPIEEEVGKESKEESELNKKRQEVLASEDAESLELSLFDIKEDLEESRKKRHGSKIYITDVVEEILDQILIEYLNNKICYYDTQSTKIWQELDKDTFGKLCKDFLSADIINKLTSLSVLDASFRFISYDYHNKNRTILLDHSYCAVENGIVNLETGEMEKFSSKFLVINKINASYDIESEEPTVFLNFIKNMTDDYEGILYMLADWLFTSPPRRRIYWFGPSMATGKSVLGDFMRRFFGLENCSCITTNEIGTKFGLSNLFECRFNISMENSGKITKNARTKLKELSSDSIITVERKYKNMKTVINTTRMCFASNDPIECDTDDEAFWDRIYLIPTMKSVPHDKRDIHLIDKIWAEKDAILSLLVKKAMELKRMNFLIPESETAKQLKCKWREESRDELTEFANDCIYCKELMSFTTTKVLQEQFENAYGVTLTTNVFSKRFKEAMHKQGKEIEQTKKKIGDKQQRGFYGVQYMPREELNDEE